MQFKKVFRNQFGTPSSWFLNTMPQVKGWIVVDYIILEEEKSNTNQILLLKNGIFIKNELPLLISSHNVSLTRDMKKFYGKINGSV